MLDRIKVCRPIKELTIRMTDQMSHVVSERRPQEKTPRESVFIELQNIQYLEYFEQCY